MARALELARKVKGNTSPNPAVGSVVVKNNRILSEGATQQAGKNHAERQALLPLKSSDTRGASLYVTMEPCYTQGRTPPCTELILEKKIHTVVIGVLDPNPKVQGRGLLELEKFGIKTLCGFFEEEIQELNEDFAKFIQKGLPFGIAKYAMTLDGKIATSKGDSKWISSLASRKRVHEIRSQVDAILIGSKTAIQDDPSLTVRYTHKWKDPLRIVLDSQLRTPLHSKLLQDPFVSLFFCKEDFRKKADTIKKSLGNSEKKEFFLDASIGSQISLRKVFEELAKRNICSILLEGGGEILASALKEKLLDKVLCFLSPKILLGKKGIFPFSGEEEGTLDDPPFLKKMRLDRIGNDVLIQGYVEYPSKFQWSGNVC